MSTRAVASAVFPVPIEKVWSEVRDFTFPVRLIGSLIDFCSIEDHATPFTVGAVRTLRWKTGETRKDRLLELSDQYRRITWELIEADPPTEASAAISSVKLYRITETNHTLVEWSCDFSADISNDFVIFSQKAFLENLKEMRKTLTGNSN